MIYHLSHILLKNDNSIIILDFIVPYYINLFKSRDTRLVIETYNSLIDLLSIIDFDKLILNQNDYNTFNDYIFENIYKLYFKCEKLEVQCAIISRIDEIIELENNFLYSFLNTISYTANEDKSTKKDLKQSLYNSNILYQSLIFNGKNNKQAKDETRLTFNKIYKIYNDDLTDFKRKLKSIIEHTLVNFDDDNTASNDCLKLLIIQKYKEICIFC
jgi:hypothetical protein